MPAVVIAPNTAITADITATMRHQPPYRRNRDVLRTVDATFAAFLRCGEFGHIGEMLTLDAITTIISIEGVLAGAANPNMTRVYATALRALIEKFGSRTP